MYGIKVVYGLNSWRANFTANYPSLKDARVAADSYAATPEVFSVEVIFRKKNDKYQVLAVVK